MEENEEQRNEEQRSQKAKEAMKRQVKARSTKAGMKLGKKALSSAVKIARTVAAIIAPLLTALAWVFAALAIVFILFTAISWLLDLFQSDKTPKEMYEYLEVEDVMELVEIKGTEENGYYWDFVDGVDDKIDNITEDFSKKVNLKNMPEDDKEFIKKIIKAQVFTQLPDLGGTATEDGEAISTGNKKLYFIEVDLENQLVLAYESRNEDGTYTDLVRAMVCSTAKDPTVLSHYAQEMYSGNSEYETSERKDWHLLDGNTYGQYVTRIGKKGESHILFHSVPYEQKNAGTLKYEEYNKLGQKASAGCIRLTVEDAKWIYDNCELGSFVKFVASTKTDLTNVEIKQPVELEKKASKDNWDPTDPNPDNPYKEEQEKEKEKEKDKEETEEVEETEETEEAPDPTEAEGVTTAQISENAFQGAIKIRRVTPNKEIGEMKNTGVEESVVVEKEIAYDTNDVDLKAKEDVVKAWEKDQKFIIDSIGSYIYEQSKSEINEGEMLDEWHWKLREGSSTRYMMVIGGKEVIYTGEYIASQSKNTIFVKIKDLEGKELGYVYYSALEKVEGVVEEGEGEGEEVVVDNTTTSRAATPKIDLQNTVPEGLVTEVEPPNLDINKLLENNTNNNNTNNNNNSNNNNGNEANTQNNETEEDRIYTIAIAAGHNDDDNTGATGNGLVEQELTIQVAERVEELFKNYDNIKVVQTGSTSKNTGGVKKTERTELAKKANPDLCIQIHFNIGKGTGVEVVYREGDGVSSQLATVLSKTISDKMGLENRGAKTDIEVKNAPVVIIENSATSGFPSVITEGGFLDNSSDAEVIKNGGIENYAQGIVDGVLEYLDGDIAGSFSNSVDLMEEAEGIESIIKDLKFVPMEEFNKYIEEDDIKGLDVFTLDEDKRLITASWSIDKKGTTDIRSNSPMDIKTSLQKYVMPFEYLLFYYINSTEKTFPSQLADKVLETEIIIAVQDNINTSQTTENTLQRTEGNNWNSIMTNNSLEEYASPSIEVTYADTWSVRFFKENSYSTEYMNMAGTDSQTVNVKGTVTYTEQSSVEYTSENQKKISKIETYNNRYNSGEAKTQGNEEKFTKIYVDNRMSTMIKEEWLFRAIENNPKTANLLNLTKYLIYKATGVNYGVIEYDYNEYNMSSFGFVGGLYGSTIEAQVWNYFRASGFSEESTAAIMGNLYQESGMDPTRLQNGRGPAAGICQMETYGNYNSRWGEMAKLAESKGKDWTDLQSQLEFMISDMPAQFETYTGKVYYYKNGTQAWWPTKLTIDDYKAYTKVDEATKIFSQVFERPSIPHMQIRISKANEYFEMFKGTPIMTGVTGAGGTVISVEGDGYSQMYISSTGRTYKEYKQSDGSYKGVKFGSKGGNISSVGCSITGVAIIASGYNCNKDPSYWSKGDTTLAAFLRREGVDATEYEFPDIAKLTSGKPALVNIKGFLKTERGIKDYNRLGHFIAILDARNGDEVYVSDPGSSNSGGWTKIQDIIDITYRAESGKRAVIYVNN